MGNVRDFSKHELLRPDTNTKDRQEWTLKDNRQNSYTGRFMRLKRSPTGSCWRLNQDP